jgi:hypothetical protein
VKIAFIGKLEFAIAAHMLRWLCFMKEARAWAAVARVATLTAAETLHV